MYIMGMFSLKPLTFFQRFFDSCAEETFLICCVLLTTSNIMQMYTMYMIDTGKHLESSM